MASLVAPLACGIAGAASGTASFYRQGTSTLAAVYSDPEGETQVTSHALDANGGIVRYVEERVDVVVADTNGATVRSFTWGTDARDARVENLGFTGPDEDGQIVGGGRTTVDAVLTSLFASLGATDGMVDVNGTPQTLSESISSSAGLVYNVKLYGALGNGTTNDAPAIQATLNAAAAAGGGIIYFPHGTYLINSALSVASGEGKFTYLGESASGTSLKQGTSGITMLALGASNSNLILGLTFTVTAAANTGTLVSVGNTGRATFLGCAFDSLNGTHILTGNSASSVATLLNCRMTQEGASSRVFGSSGGTARLVACDLTTIGTDLISFQCAFVNLDACTIIMGQSAGAAGTAILASVAGGVSITGGSIENRYASGTATLANLSNMAIAGVRLICQGGADLLLHGTTGDFAEAGCTFYDFSGSIRVPPTGVSYSATRDHRVKVTTGSATTYTPDGNYRVHEVTSSGASMAFANPSPDSPPGSGLVILYKNTSGGAIAPTFGTSYSFIGESLMYESFNGRAGAGTIAPPTIPAAGDVVKAVLGLSAAAPGERGGDFETTISVTSEIQQVSAADLSANTYLMVLHRPFPLVASGASMLYVFDTKFSGGVTADYVCVSSRTVMGTVL